MGKGILKLVEALVALRPRKAVVSDVPQIQKVVNAFADRNEMLHRSMNELFETIRDFSVIEENGEILAVAAVHVQWDDLGELKAVAVSSAAQGRGLGRQVVDHAIEGARQLGLRRVFALTYKPDFFARFGFRVVDRNTLPHKVWGECIKCHKFPDCNEIAMMRYLDQGPPKAIRD